MRKTLEMFINHRGAWSVDMPTFAMLKNAMGPVTPGHIHANGIHPAADSAAVLKLRPYVTVTLPDDTPVDMFGRLDAEGIRRMYRTHPRFGHPDWKPPREVKP